MVLKTGKRSLAKTDKRSLAKTAGPGRVGVLVALAALPLLAGCGKAGSTGAETVSARQKVERQIKTSAAAHHVALGELSCLSLTSTKLECLAHVKTSAEEATATITASFDNQAHKYHLEGPAEFVGS